MFVFLFFVRFSIYLFKFVISFFMRNLFFLSSFCSGKVFFLGRLRFLVVKVLVILVVFVLGLMLDLLLVFVCL